MKAKDFIFTVVLTVMSLPLAAQDTYPSAKREADFDVVVQPGDSIQLTIEQAPPTPEKPFIILIRKGVYRQKVIMLYGYIQKKEQ